MRLPFSKHSIITALSLCLLFWLFSFSFPVKTKTINFTIDKTSTLSIEGSSSVNSFYCGCEEEFQQYCCSLEESENSSKIHFEHAVLEVKTRSFNCGSKGINRDMWEALQAQKHPKVKIELLEVSLSNPAVLKKICEQWVSLKAQTRITIAGKSKIFFIDVKAKELQSNQFRFSGSKELLMSDFGIDPPRPLLGLIKVSDQITIDLDLVINIVES